MANCLMYTYIKPILYYRFFSLLYIKRGDIDKFYRQCTSNPLTIDTVSDGGIKEVDNI